MNPVKAAAKFLLRQAGPELVEWELRQAITAAARAAQADVLPHQVSQGVGVDWSLASYGDYYARSVPVYAAIRVRAEALVRVPWRVFQVERDGAKRLLQPGHPLRQVLDHPNPWCSGAELRRATETYLCLWGKAFWSIEPAEDGSRLELWPLRPDRVDILPGAGPRGPYIRGYRYRGQARDVFYLPEEVEAFLYFNPLQDRTGFSPIAPLRLSADMGWDALRYNRNTFRNGAIPDYILLGEQDLTEAQAEEFYRRWEERFKGPERAHRPAITSAIRDVKPLAFNQREMEFIEGLRWSVKDVSRTFGVPETMLAELQHATLSNMESLERWFWRSTVIPEAALLADHINNSLLAKLGYPGLELEFDFSGIEALSEAEEQRLRREAEYLELGVLTINEVRRQRGLEEVPWGNQPLAARERRPRDRQQPEQSTNFAAEAESSRNGHHGP